MKSVHSWLRPYSYGALGVAPAVQLADSTRPTSTAVVIRHSVYERTSALENDARVGRRRRALRVNRRIAHWRIGDAGQYAQPIGHLVHAVQTGARRTIDTVATRLLAPDVRYAILIPVTVEDVRTSVDRVRPVRRRGTTRAGCSSWRCRTAAACRLNCGRASAISA